ncbi:MAG: amine dehydrogenase large subunit [Pseudomonadota bacterium]
MTRRSILFGAVFLLVLAGIGWLFLSPGSSDETRESPFPETAFVETLEDADPGERFWVYGLGAPDFVDGRAYLFDIEGKRLGQISTGYWHTNLLPLYGRDEIVSVETYFSRGTRGERTDVVVAYDTTTLKPLYEIVIPSKRMMGITNNFLVSSTQDEQFLAVTNYTPAQTLTIVDLESKAFVEEVETPGCMIPHAGGERSFFLICSNGAFMHIKLGPDGAAQSVERTPVLFDAIEDPLTAAPSKIGDTWYFMTREANVRAFTVSDDAITARDEWSLLTDSERSSGWTIAGFGHSAAHEKTGRLYALVRKGEPHQFEDPGEEVWVFDTETQKRIQRITMKDLTISIDVTQTDEPKLLTQDVHIPLSFLEQMRIFASQGQRGFDGLTQARVNVYDATSGDHIVRSEIAPSGTYLNVKAW